MITGYILPYKIIILKLLLSAFLGGIVGIERDIRGRAAGLRTHILVTVGATLFMLISTEIYNLYISNNSDSILRIDPARIAAQIITGIGFIGAGAIIHSGIDIRGLTTAGCIWLCAGVGMAIGISYYVPAITATFIALFSLIFLNKIELLYFKDAYVKLEVILKSSDNILEDFKNFIKKDNFDLRLFKFEHNYEDRLLKITLLIKLKYRTKKNFYSKTLINGIEENFKKNLKSIAWKEPSD